eukprot:8604654-Pyramimonas_sp.AAC.1
MSRRKGVARRSPPAAVSAPRRPCSRLGRPCRWRTRRPRQGWASRSCCTRGPGDASDWQRRHAWAARKGQDRRYMGDGEGDGEDEKERSTRKMRMTI